MSNIFKKILPGVKVSTNDVEFNNSEIIVSINRDKKLKKDKKEELIDMLKSLDGKISNEVRDRYQERILNLVSATSFTIAPIGPPGWLITIYLYLRENSKNNNFWKKIINNLKEIKDNTKNKNSLSSIDSVLNFIKDNNSKLNVNKRNKYLLEMTEWCDDSSMAILTEAMSSSKRKQIEDYVLEFMTKLDITGNNTKRYRQFFNSLDTDANFEAWLKYFLNNPKEHFQVQAVPFEEPKINKIKETADWMNVPLEEYMYYRHDGNKDDPIRTAVPVPIGYIHIKRMQQILSKKNKYSFDTKERDAKTGQTTGESKVARISTPEVYALTTLGADKALEEFMSARSDNESKKLDMYKAITQDGYFKLSDLETDIGKSTTLNTIDAYLIAAGVKSDLVTPDLKTLATIKKGLGKK